MFRSTAALFVVVCSLSVARAGSSDDPDTEIARARFSEGSSFYEKRDYPRALKSFEAARRVKPLPELDYNIARCLDRMERPEQAVAAYERYLAAKPTAKDAAEVRERLGVLRARMKTHTPTPHPSTIVGTRWNVTNTADKTVLEFRFLARGRLVAAARPGKTKSCTWKQSGGLVQTQCGSEGIGWVMQADHMHGQSAQRGWSAQRTR